MALKEIPIREIYSFTRKRIFDPTLAEDVAQTACLYALTHREARPWQYVFDAIRSVIGHSERSRNLILARQMIAPDEISSTYSTEDELINRFLDEETEDQLIEWHSMSAAEKDERIRESEKSLGTSPSSTSYKPIKNKHGKRHHRKNINS